MNYLCNMFTKVMGWYRRRRFWVIADPTDNSITFSKALFKHMDVMEMDVAMVYVFRVGTKYAFVINPEFDHPTQLADIQYNDKYKTVGFECLVPTVNRIFYDYGLPHDKRVKLTVAVRKTGKLVYYELCCPVDRGIAAVNERVGDEDNAE